MVVLVLLGCAVVLLSVFVGSVPILATKLTVKKNTHTEFSPDDFHPMYPDPPPSYQDLHPQEEARE